MGDMMVSEVAIALRGLRLSYPNATGSAAATAAVDGVDLDIRKGEWLGLVGESGCGKSSLAKLILRLVKPTEGQILLDGCDVTALTERQMRPLRKKIQMIFQDSLSSLDPRMRAGSIIMEPLRVHRLLSGGRAERVAELLRLVGLNPESASRFPHEFSGGQRQRIGIARALAVQPEIVVCDEPISALDVSVQAQVLNLLADLQKSLRLTYLFISHNLTVTAMYSDRVAVMYFGQLVEVCPASSLKHGALHPYTTALISATPLPDPDAERNRARVRLPPEFFRGSADGGCRFRSRCWLYAKLGQPDACSQRAPDLRSFSSDHSVRCHFPEAAREAQSAA